VVEEEHLYGCISPRGSPCQSPQPYVSAAYEREGMDAILDPVLHITPEFHELCEESSKVLPLEMGSSKALVILLPQSPASLVSGAVLAHSSDALLLKSFGACSRVWRRLALDMARTLHVSWRERLPRT
jgi:hypothetical protein